jgi:hypothetical protein
VIQVADFSADASQASWQDFLKTLTQIRAASERGSVVARLHPPARCASEARRVIRDMGLGDCVELIEPAAGSRSDALPGGEREGVMSRGRALLTRLGFTVRASAFKR